MEKHNTNKDNCTLKKEEEQRSKRRWEIKEKEKEVCGGRLAGLTAK